MDTVIFACVHNAGRSQMAMAFFNALVSPDKARAISAGTEPAKRVHSTVVEVMRERNIDVSANHPQLLNDELAASGSLLVTMGCGDQCPYLPGLERMDWPIPDPRDRSIVEVRAIRDDILRRVRELIDTRGWTIGDRS